MIIYKRRFQGIIAVSILFVVMLGGLIHDPMVRSEDIPSLKSTAPLVKKIRNYFNTRMNYAATGPFLRGLIFYSFNSSGDRRVYIGKNQRLYYADENVFPQSSGMIYRSAEVLHFADIVTALSRELTARGARLIVTSPPNTQSVATRDLPAWYQTKEPLEYDLFMKELSARGIETVDLKTYFRARNDRDSLYLRTDTHWAMRGAILAFNQVMERAGHPDWNIAPESPGSVRSDKTGDLARFTGLQSYLYREDILVLPASEENWQKIDVFPVPQFEPFDFYAYQHKQVAEGERILVIGDSFSQGFWRPLLLKTNAERVGWMHHSKCWFYFGNVDAFKPTLVILATNERHLPCPEIRWPVGMPRL